MKKIIILIIGIVTAVPAFCQQEELVLIQKRWPNRVDVNVTPGLVHHRIVSDDSDTAFYFHANGKKYIATTTFKEVAGPIEEETVTVIDSTPDNPANKYYGSWQHRSGTSWLSNFHDQTGSYTTGTADSLVIMVDGYKVEWYSEKLNNHGTAEVRIDNKFAAGIDLYANRTDNNSQLVWTGLMLTDGPHKITIRYTGQKNDASTSATIIHDYIKVFKN